MFKRKEKPPNACYICHKPIGAFKPHYTISVKRHFSAPYPICNWEQTYCQTCFQKFENFLIEKRTEANHAQNYQDMMKGAM